MLVQTLVGIFSGVVNLFLRILYIPFAVLGFLSTVASYWKTLFALVAIGVVFYGVGQVGGPIISTTFNTINNRLSPVYHNTLRPIVAGIIQVHHGPM